MDVEIVVAQPLLSRLQEEFVDQIKPFQFFLKPYSQSAIYSCGPKSQTYVVKRKEVLVWPVAPIVPPILPKPRE